MEGELNTLIEQNNLLDKRFEIHEEEEDDFHSNSYKKGLDIKEFEKKLIFKGKINEAPPIIIKGFVYNDNEPDSSIEEEKEIKPDSYGDYKQEILNSNIEKENNKNNKTNNKNIKNFEENESKLDQITKEIATSKGIINNKAKKEDLEIEKALNSKDESLKDRKIKELTQKNKALNVAFEHEKALRMKSEKDLAQILKETEANIDKLEGKPLNKKKEEGSLEDWKNKHSILDKKVQELRFEKQSMKNELNKALRVIAKEIGENMNLDEILLQENSWKGRSQQIQLLQTKRKSRDLKGKLISSRDISNIGNQNTEYSEKRNEMNGSNYSQMSIQSKGADERRKEIEALKIHNISMKSENELLQSKIKALNSRKSILETEVKEIKAQYDENKKLLVEKSGNDDKYIQALKNEIEKLKQQISNLSSSFRTKEAQNPEKTKDSTLIKLPPDYEKLKNEYLMLKDQMDQKEKIIKELINEKVKDSSFRINEDSNMMGNNAKKAEEARIRELESELMIIKKENEELVKTISANIDKDSEFTIKNLCNQNAQLRKKMYDLQVKIDAKSKNK